MNLSKSKVFLVCCLVFICGIALASFLPLKYVQKDLYWFGGVMVSVIVLILFWQYRKFRLVALVSLFLFLALWRYSIALPIDTQGKLWHYNGQRVVFSGVIVEEPDIRDSNVKYKIQSRELKSFDKNIEGNVLVTTNLYPRYDYGDELEVACELKTPEEFSGFAYDRYLARYDIYSVCYYPKVGLLSSGNGVWFYTQIYNIKNKFRDIIDYGLGEPESSLARAIILGDKRGIPDDLRDKFSQTGVSHIVAISGMHISILSGLVMASLLGLGLNRKQAFYAAILFLIIYIIMIGAPASAMRAGIMGSLVLLALYIGRFNKITNSLVLAGAVLLIFNPFLLRDDIGFQLSFLAVVGIIYVYPILDNWLDRIKISKFKGARDILNITLSAQVFTLPIIALNFSQVSIIAPLANLLIIWALPILMILILLALGLSFLFFGLAPLFFAPSLLFLKYIILVVEWLASVPYAYTEIDYLWWGWALLYYIVVMWGIIKLKNQENN